MARGIVIAACLVPAVLSGCYAKQWAREPITVEENAAALAGVISRQDELDDRLGRLEEKMSTQLDLIRSMRADDSQFDEEIRASLLAIRELFSDSRGQLEDVAGRIDRVLRRQAAAPTGAAAGDSVSVAGGAPAMIDPQPLYNAAYIDLIRGNYATALVGFDSFLAAYPDGALADDARYWMGECYLAEGNAAEAAAQFERVEADFPSSERIPPALLKLGGCYIDLGKRDEARKTFTRLFEKYPQSVEAPLAEEMLKELD